MHVYKEGLIYEGAYFKFQFKLKENASSSLTSQSSSALDRLRSFIYFVVVACLNSLI